MPRRVSSRPRTGLPWQAVAGGGRGRLPESSGGASDQGCFLGQNCLFDIIRALKMESCLLLSPSSPLPGAGVLDTRGERRRLVESRRIEQLSGIPGRLSDSGATDVASLYTLKGNKEVNQDSMLLWENFCFRRDTVFCGVFDGHGEYGHLVSNRVRDVLPLKLSAYLRRSNRKDSIDISGSKSSKETPLACLDEETRISLEDEISTLGESFLKASRVIDKDLRLQANINCFDSGTTAIAAIKKGQDLVIANVGDSRAVLGTKDQNNHLVALQLTVDQKPNVPREAERIRQCNGRVFARQLHDAPRVWLPTDDSSGLAIARTFGDFMLKDFGLISVPDIHYRRISESDKFLVLASDGVWDVLSNTEVVNIVASAPSRSSAAGLLVKSAHRAWRHKYQPTRIDDCSAVCLFLNTDATLGPAKNMEGTLDPAQALKLQACLPSSSNNASSAITQEDEARNVSC